jgi:Histidine kinase
VVAVSVSVAEAGRARPTRHAVAPLAEPVSRFAWEMHDVLAHRLSLLSVHAGPVEFRPDAPPGEIAEAPR